MKNFVAGFLLGAVLMAVTGWYYVAGHRNRHARYPQDSPEAALQHAADVIEGKLQAWHLTGDDIDRELTRTGRVVRRQVGDFGAAMADAATDARITAQVKTKFALDRDLSAWKISVATTSGHVTLSGTVASHALIGRAMLLALETDGVREVTSALQIAR